MQEKVLIVDFGSQYTQLIARRVRELFIFCEIYPFNSIPENLKEYKAVKKAAKLPNQKAK